MGAGVSRIHGKFSALKADGRAALIPYIMAGDPDLSVSYSLIQELERRGADLIELGVPFSDPVADGPVIQKASERALRQKTTLAGVLDLARSSRKLTEIPLILMTYYNPIHRYGEARFVHDAVACGIDGVIIPDLPPEEADSLLREARPAGLDVVFLLAPTSTPERIRQVSSRSSGFIYYVSLTGITGAGLGALEEVEARVRRIRRTARLPVAVGFGISNPEQAARIARWADGVIVGSALVKLVEEHQGDSRLIQSVGSFIQSMHDSVHLSS